MRRDAGKVSCRFATPIDFGEIFRGYPLRRREGSREIVSIWQRRYHDFNIFSAKKLNEKIDYIHYNPVERGLCRTPEEYLWSSARFYSEGKSVGVKIKPIVYME